jgi:uncharacterized SAM-binding protein YcdF (DUF218 family)
VIFGPIKLALKILSAVLSVILIYFLVTFVQVWLTGRDHATNDANAILVFGTAELNGRPSAELQYRLTEALILYDAKRAPYIAVTGYKQPGDLYTEAGVSATYLESQGVPKDQIIEGGGTDTWSNVSSIVAKLRAADIKTVLTVTDGFHEDRAMAICSSQGLTPFPAPVTQSAISGSALWGYYFTETIEVGVGRVIGYHTLSDWIHDG